MGKERTRPGAFETWVGKPPPSGWKRPFLRFEWCCEWGVYRLRRWAFVELLELTGRFAILLSVVWFVWNYRADTEERLKANRYRAWQIINLAQGKPGNGGRADALADLIKGRVSLACVDLKRADLPGANLSGADLKKADLDWANLYRADLHEADLQGARLQAADLRETTLAQGKLQGAFLRGADARGVNLSQADLSRADLQEANLEKADLQGAHAGQAIFLWAELPHAALHEADLSRANLRYSELRDADLSGADLKEADLRSARGLTCEQLQTAKKWHEAYRDEEFACGELLPKPPEMTPTPE